MNIQNCSKEDIKTIVDGINNYNLDKVPALSDVWTPIELIIKDDHGNAIGGLLGGIGYWNGFEIKLLWVEEPFRKKGYGTKILKHAEQLAKDKGASISMLDTFSFQAEGFYMKNDYKVIGEIKDFPQGHRRIYFSKKL